MSGVASWLALNRAPGLTPDKLQRLVKRFKSPETVLAAAKDGVMTPSLCSEHTLAYLMQPDWREIEKDLAWLEAEDHHVVTYQQDAYPSLLRQIPSAPFLLFCKGDIGLLNHPLHLAVVGSRQPTPGGRQNAYRFGSHLAQLGFSICSGLAHGIDAAAHKGALAVKGATLAVLAHGMDLIYPKSHDRLAREIVDAGGLLISEYAIGVPPTRSRFPQRNRIISGLSLGTLVVEAAARSGALITAELAVEQGREVFAMPGPIGNPMARGCHKLIKQGAKLVQDVVDIVEELVPQIELPKNDANLSHFGLFSSEYAEILNHVGYEPVSADLIIESCGRPASMVTSQLLELELQGKITAMPGGKFVRA